MGAMRSCWSLGVVAVVLTVGIARAAPTTYTPALAISDPAFNAISVTGTGFGAPQGGSSLRLTEGTTTTVMPSTDREVLVWAESQIVVKVLPASHPATVAVTVGGDTTEAHPWLCPHKPLAAATIWNAPVKCDVLSSN